MSRSGYSEDCDNGQLYRAAVGNALLGKRGQAFLKKLLAEMEAMPVKRLITDELQIGDEVCTLGVMTRAMGIDPLKEKLVFDIYDEEYVINQLEKRLNIANSMVRELMWVNDEGLYWGTETPEQRWERVHKWVKGQIYVRSR